MTPQFLVDSGTEALIFPEGLAALLGYTIGVLAVSGPPARGVDAANEGGRRAIMTVEPE